MKTVVLKTEDFKSAYFMGRGLEFNTCAFFGTIVPLTTKSLLPVVRTRIGKNCPQGPPLKFQGETFGAIKIFGKKIFNGGLTGSAPEIQ